LSSSHCHRSCFPIHRCLCSCHELLVAPASVLYMLNWLR
jgi:hypothetical protein